MIKVLYFVDRLRRGGIQSLLYDMLQYLDKERIRMDVLTLDDRIHYDLEDAIQQLGVTIYKLQDVWIRKPWDYWAYARSMKRFFLQHSGYHAVHMNSSSKNFGVLYYAKKMGIPVRIAHAHNTGFQTPNPIYQLVGNALKPLLCHYATHLLACSAKAGQWMFGEEAYQSGRIEVVPNGIIVANFAYDKEWRRQLRAEIGIDEDCLLIGNVGRLVKQKNHAFLLPVATELKRRRIKFKILFIGSGELEGILRNEAERLDLVQEIIFLGFREDRNKWYSAMDIFAMPSLYEGFPITLVEAQAAGLPIIASDAVTREAKLPQTEDFIYLSITDENRVNEWAEAMIHEHPVKREFGRNQVEKTMFNIQSMLDKLYAIYEQ
jgi:glycosyltransferase involved in cell wall biosynthesis